MRIGLSSQKGPQIALNRYRDYSGEWLIGMVEIYTTKDPATWVSTLWTERDSGDVMNSLGL